MAEQDYLIIRIRLIRFSNIETAGTKISYIEKRRFLLAFFFHSNHPIFLLQTHQYTAQSTAQAVRSRIAYSYQHHPYFIIKFVIHPEGENYFFYLARHSRNPKDSEFNEAMK
ncbi:hypothetical protein [Hydrogenispora ethanolica]|uniref:hypothetical protein n=1 Tax=Hydrogenispora ethanolica TaxID=1082276 RepID=UPI0014042B89|nr:hypothetical protein [Hydrogenispora ethanolica]